MAKDRKKRRRESQCTGSPEVSDGTVQCFAVVRCGHCNEVSSHKMLAIDLSDQETAEEFRREVGVDNWISMDLEDLPLMYIVPKAMACKNCGTVYRRPPRGHMREDWQEGGG